MLSPSKKKGGKITALTIAVTGIFLYIGNAATQGVIGDFATHELPWFATSLVTTQVPLILLLLSFVATLGGGYAWWRVGRTKDREIESIANTSCQLTGMYSSIFFFIQGMIDARNISLDELDKVTKKAIEFLLAQATPLFGRAVYSGAFFASDGNVLKIWAHYRISQADVEDKDLQFDLSQPARSPIGMARASYENRTVEVGHIDGDEHGWRCTNQHYIKIGRLGGPMQIEPLPPYSSLICVPVLSSLKKHHVPLGVVCFYSHERSTFDNPQINRLAEQIVERISEALQFYQYLNGKRREV
jgi:hypothetical protein